MSEQRHSLRLNEAREQTPAVSPVEAMRRQLALAVFDAVKEKDLTDMVNLLKTQAQAGDLKAMKMYFELVGVMGKTQPPPPPPQDSGIKQLAEAMQDLVDEIRVSKRPLPEAERKKLANGHARNED